MPTARPSYGAPSVVPAASVGAELGLLLDAAVGLVLDLDLVLRFAVATAVVAPAGRGAAGARARRARSAAAVDEDDDVVGFVVDGLRGLAVAFAPAGGERAGGDARGDDDTESV